jgi:hypothetical protein
MSLETKIADNFIYDATFNTPESDTQKTPFLRKNLTFVTDSQNGSGTYTSGQLTFDGTSLAAVGGNSVQDWSNAYIVLPYNVKVTMSGATGYTTTVLKGANYLAGVKNNSLIDSITVEHMGKTIINQTANLSHLVNFKMHAITSPSDLQKASATRQYFPDSVGNSTTTASIAGTKNTDNNPTITTSNIDGFEVSNSGLLRRQQMMSGWLATNYNTAAYLKQEADYYQSVTAFPSPSLTTAQNYFDLHYNAIIYLKDLSDYFAKHTISRGAGYKVYVRVNQAVTTLTTASTTTPFALTPTNTITALTSGTVQPAILSIGTNSLCAGMTLGTAEVSSIIVTSRIDTTADARPNGLRLYVPGYDCSPDTIEKITRQPIIRRPFMDIFNNVIQNQGTQAYINQQIAGAISRPCAIIVIPQLAQATQTQTSQASVFNPCPGTTDPQLSLTQFQIKVGSQYVLPDRLNYSFNAFIENTAQMFGLNGNQSRELSSGVIDIHKFRNNYRYYAFDLSRYPEAQGATPQLISLECFNNSSVSVDLYVYVLWNRDCSVNIRDGSIEVE